MGAQKAGTTYLHEILARNKRIGLPSTKETKFFLKEEEMSLGLERYYAQFRSLADIDIIGEVDPDYLFFDAIAKISSVFQDAKYIILLRNPYHRAVSHFKMMRSRGIDKREFYDAIIRDFDEAEQTFSYFADNFSYFRRGLYSRQIELALTRCNSDRLKIILFDDLTHEPKSTIEEVFSFLGVDYDEVSLANADRHVYRDTRFEFLSQVLYGQNAVKRALRIFIPYEARVSITRYLIKLNNRFNKASKSLPSNHEEFCFPDEVVLAYEAEITRLESRLGRDLSHWRQV